jgi:hypothetical protein
MSRQSVIDYKKSLYTDNWNPLLSGTEIELNNIFDKQYYTFFNFPVSLFSWITTWLKQYSIQNKFLIFILIGSIINLVFITVLQLINFSNDFFKIKQNGYIIISIISFVAIQLWFINAPSIRYGYGFIIIMIALQLSFWLLLFCQLKDINYQRWFVFFTLFSIVLILFDIEMKNFTIQRSLTKNQYNQVYEFIDVRGKSTLEDFYNFDNKNQMYVMKLFLPLPDKIRIIKMFLKANDLKLFDNPDAIYPIRSSKGNYRPNDGFFGVNKRLLFPSRYPINPVEAVQFGTFTFYEMSSDIKSWGGWYESFPFSPGYLNRIELRGTTLKNGFRLKY